MTRQDTHEESFRFDPAENPGYSVDGLPITPELLQRAAEAAEVPAGVVARPWLKPGGKSLSGGSAHSPRFQVVLGDVAASKLRERAAADNMSISRWLRRVVERELAA